MILTGYELMFLRLGGYQSPSAGDFFLFELSIFLESGDAFESIKPFNKFRIE
ncbi:MAG: hypothetical protein UX04_C0004G0026 [Microgenomates group bacterium GW2011_GWF2_45_18]|nr:MAG: hypothetical protein UW18_C0004G0026 [Microgenomates group bacterium GW2011_GWF1_44_10]KKU01682.1 MAG: hypothetical protein UX04_C0004G0026 [Microgenomates group bacterium GW2011_GWF2_45_18]